MSLIKDSRLKKIIKNTGFVTVLTGSGISAESGIHTFRGDNGLWSKFSPDELASFEGFYKNPARVMEWYEYRRNVILKAKPNPGHFAIAEIEKYVQNFYLITQNIDRLHQKAGSRNVIELHGNIMENYCIKCGKMFSLEEFEKIYNESSDRIPKCECKGLIRPNVVWFGEQLPEDAVEKAYYASVNCDLFIIVGTSGAVRPASDFPRYAKYNGAYIIEVNPCRSFLTDFVDLWFEGKAGEILPEFVEEFKNLKGING